MTKVMGLQEVSNLANTVDLPAAFCHTFGLLAVG